MTPLPLRLPTWVSQSAQVSALLLCLGIQQYPAKRKFVIK
jgi:hypothetical protein